MAKNTVNATHQRLNRRRHGRMQLFLKKAKFIVVLASIPAALVGIVYGIFFSQYFSIQTIDIQAPPSLAIDELRSDLYRQLDNTAFGFLPQRNIFLFDITKASQKISSKILIESLTIRKSFPRTIKISLSGKKFELLWYTKGVVWMVGANGVLIVPADQTDVASLPLDVIRKRYGNNVLLVNEHIQKRASIPPLIIDITQQDGHEGLSVIDQQYVETLMTLRDHAAKNGIDSAYVLYTKGEPTITLVTREGWDLVMTLDADISKQLKNASTLLSHSIKKKRTKLKNIDVRFDNRLYYTLH